MNSSQDLMKKSFFHSFPLNPYPGRKRLTDKAGTQLEKTTLRVIDNDFPPGLLCLSFWHRNRKDGMKDGRLFPASAR